MSYHRWSLYSTYAKNLLVLFFKQ